jgi:hypothetical protein
VCPTAFPNLTLEVSHVGLERLQSLSTWPSVLSWALCHFVSRPTPLANPDPRWRVLIRRRNLSCLTRHNVMHAAAPSRSRQRRLAGLIGILSTLVATGSLIGLLAAGGPGRQVIQTARGASVTLYGEGLYAADTWLIGAGNQGQDLAMLIFELPILLLIVRWYWRGSPVAPAVLTGALAFLTYYYVSLVFGIAQNRLFPLYVAAASLAGFALVLVTSRLNVNEVAAALPAQPGRKILAAYLIAVAAALTLAWLPGMIITAVTGDMANAVGPYTSTATEALDLGLVVPVAVIAAVQLLRQRPLGSVLALIMLVVNVCIGAVLMAQGAAQLVSGVPLTASEIVTKMVTFAALTLVAGGLLARTAHAAASNAVRSGPSSLVR